MVTESLPLILLGAVGVVVLATRLLQFLQRVVFKVLPFGALGNLSLLDVGIGILITGSYYLYFCTSRQHAPALFFFAWISLVHTLAHTNK